jgi:hypothetical protein
MAARHHIGWLITAAPDIELLRQTCRAESSFTEESVQILAECCDDKRCLDLPLAFNEVAVRPIKQPVAFFGTRSLAVALASLGRPYLNRSSACVETPVTPPRPGFLRLSAR